MKAAYGFSTAIRLLVKAILQSPDFLYRVELGMPSPGDAGAVPLGQYEMASRLSYLLWNSMPDDELFAAADAGERRRPEQLAAQARRMLEDDRARIACDQLPQPVARARQGRRDRKGCDPLSQLRSQRPRAHAQPRPRRSSSTWCSRRTGYLRTMLHGQLQLDERAARGLLRRGGADGRGLREGGARPGQGVRPAHASELARAAREGRPDLAGAPWHSSCAGASSARRRLLRPTTSTPRCRRRPNATTREQFAQHTADPRARAVTCSWTPSGSASSTTTRSGLWRDEEHGLPVDATGEIVLDRRPTTAFSTGRRAGSRLAESEEVRACLARNGSASARARRDEAGRCSASCRGDVRGERRQHPGAPGGAHADRCVPLPHPGRGRGTVKRLDRRTFLRGAGGDRHRPALPRDHGAQKGPW